MAFGHMLSVAGVTHENRGELIAKLKKGDPVQLEQTDAGAIQVLDFTGQLLGYIGKDDKEKLISLCHGDFEATVQACGTFSSRGEDLPFLRIKVVPGKSKRA